MMCTACKELFVDSDSLGSEYQLCQMCWESFCASSWWQEIELLAAYEGDLKRDIR